MRGLDWIGAELEGWEVAVVWERARRESAA